MSIRSAIPAFLLLAVTLVLANCALEEPESGREEATEDEIIDTEEASDTEEISDTQGQAAEPAEVFYFSSLPEAKEGSTTDSSQFRIGPDATCRSCASMKTQARAYCARINRRMCNAVCTPKCPFNQAGFVDMRFNCCR